MAYFILIGIKKNCPGGCPCETFACSETTTVPDVTTSTAPATTTIETTITTTQAPKNSVLVLSTYRSSNKPMVVTFDGKFLLKEVKRKEIKMLIEFSSPHYFDFMQKVFF